jgi:hypothetical protein
MAAVLARAAGPAGPAEEGPGGAKAAADVPPGSRPGGPEVAKERTGRAAGTQREPHSQAVDGPVLARAKAVLYVRTRI